LVARPGESGYEHANLKEYIHRHTEHDLRNDVRRGKNSGKNKQAKEYEFSAGSELLMIDNTQPGSDENRNRQFEYNAKGKQERNQETHILVNRKHRRGQILAGDEEKVQCQFIDIAIAEYNADQKQDQCDEEQESEKPDFIVIQGRLHKRPDLIEDERTHQHNARHQGKLELCGERFADSCIDDLYAARLNRAGDEFHQRIAKEIKSDDKTDQNSDQDGDNKFAKRHQVGDKRLSILPNVCIVLAGGGRRLFTHPSSLQPQLRSQRQQAHLL